MVHSQQIKPRVEVTEKGFLIRFVEPVELNEGDALRIWTSGGMTPTFYVFVERPIVVEIGDE